MKMNLFTALYSSPASSAGRNVDERVWLCNGERLRDAAICALLTLVLAGTAAAEEFTGREKLRAHSNEFRKEVITVTDGVYVAVGYSASNVILIQGEGGSIIADTASNPVEAREARAAFGNLLDARVRAIIYTHGHPDHTGGATVFAGDGNPDIYSHRLLVEGRPDVARGIRDGGDQFGMTLPDSLYINAGIQLQYGRITPPTREGYVPPTRTFSGDEMSLTVAGVRLQLLHTPGETSENTAVWLPEKRVLIPGDDFYRAFPNLYAIRGVRLRPPDQWIASLDKMIDLEAEYLMPGHMRPISGADGVRAALTAYRDASNPYWTRRSKASGEASGPTSWCSRSSFRLIWPRRSHLADSSRRPLPTAGSPKIDRAGHPEPASSGQRLQHRLRIALDGSQQRPRRACRLAPALFPIA
jgi:glyoxylase-like metal-dependent hydrolase (beta-lactamase superfamily II)